MSPIGILRVARVQCIVRIAVEAPYILMDLVCIILWSLAAELLGSSPSIDIGPKLCFSSPALYSLQLLACVLSIYHFCTNDVHYIFDGTVVVSSIVHRRVYEAGKTI